MGRCRWRVFTEENREDEHSLRTPLHILVSNEDLQENILACHSYAYVRHKTEDLPEPSLKTAKRGKVMERHQLEPTLPVSGKESPEGAFASERVSQEGDYRPQRRSDLNFRDVEGETVILDRRGGFVRQLNQTASFIWALCDGTSTIDDIVNHLLEAYEVNSRTALNDVKGIVAELSRLNLLENPS
jgi:hypothetical protein